MIYQLEVYYGALLGDKAVYTIAVNFEDCTKLLENPINDEPYKQVIMEQIEKDGFDPAAFRFDWITKSQYENRMDSKVLASCKISK